MQTTLRIALRFLLAKRRAMMMSLSGIAFGVGFIVLTQAVTSGFQEFFIQTILGTDGAIRVQDKQQMEKNVLSADAEPGKGPALSLQIESARVYQEGVAEPQLQMDAIRAIPEVRAVSQVLRGNVSIQSSTREAAAQVYGIVLQNQLEVSDLGRQVILGSTTDFAAAPSGVMIGSVMAQTLRIRLGDSVLISYAGQSTRFRVVAIYETGVREIDRARIFMHLNEVRALLKKPFGATFLQVSLRDPDRAREISARIQEVTDHRSESWQVRERVWLGVFDFFSISAWITVSTIIVVSGLGMFNTLAMIVMEKTKEIAILRSMGFTRRDVATVFMLQGGLVLLAGLALGWLLGAVCTWATESYPLQLRGVFSTDHIVVSWQWQHYVGAGLAATIVVIIASWFPARRAAAMEPAGIIRGASQ